MVENSEIKRNVLAKAMELAAERGWRAVTLADVADRAGMPMAALYEVIRSKADIFCLLGEEADRSSLEGAKGFEPDDTVRDRLFDLVMRRFDALNPYKAGLRAIVRDVATDPLAAVGVGCRAPRSAGLMLEAAGVSTSGLSGAARVAGLTAAYGYAMRAWFDDDTADLSRTMAALDKALRRGEALAEFVWRGRRPSHGEATGGGPGGQGTEAPKA